MPSSALLLNALKVSACLHLAAVALQPVLAGRHFGGDAWAMSIHGPLGETAAWLALVQAAIAILAAVRQWLPPLAAAACVAIFALDGLQVHFGHARTLALHIPLGASILALSLVLTLWLFRRGRVSREIDGVGTGDR